MMPHFINVLHQNCHRQQMTSVRIINHHNPSALAHHFNKHRIFNRAKEFVKALRVDGFDAQAKELLGSWPAIEDTHRRSQCL
jgi:hypothetical protein